MNAKPLNPKEHTMKNNTATVDEFECEPGWDSTGLGDSMLRLIESYKMDARQFPAVATDMEALFPTDGYNPFD